MPASFSALAVLVVALLPGALYLWSFERQAGRYGIGLSDRLLRFIGGSAVFLCFLAWPVYRLTSEYWLPISNREAVPWWLAIFPILYVFMPISVGTLIGYGQRQRWQWATLLSGPDPAPRAWDYLFQYNVDGWVRCRLKSGTWLGGAYANANGRRSYTAGYPEHQDIYLAASIEIDSETGEIPLNEEENPILGGGGILIRWEEIEYLEFIDPRQRRRHEIKKV